MSSANMQVADIVAVVLEYHRPDATFHCIKSLAAAGVMHIIVRDNSTDSGTTRTKLTDLLKNDTDLLQRVKIIGDNVNLGFSGGINVAIARTTNVQNLRYVLLINNDATINTEGVNTLLEVLACDAKLALAAPQFLSSDGEKPALLYYNRYFAALTRKKYFGSFAFLSGCCLLLDLEKTGTAPLDADFFMYGEDVALSYDLQKKGYQLAIAESAKVEHIGAASSVVGSPFYEYHVARGHILLTSKIANSSVHAVVLWPPRLISLAARSLLRAIRAKSFIPLSALWRALLALGPA
jgi:N-acetylglucosaminyl-diphospho-decaprenol L-rhamnosyltransferase